MRKRRRRIRMSIKKGVKQMNEVVVERYGKIMDLVKKEIKEINEDDRFHYPCATTDENAVLVLIQVNLEARMELAKRIEWILDGEGI
jgi:hypothetical protein